MFKFSFSLYPPPPGLAPLPIVKFFWITQAGLDFFAVIANPSKPILASIGNRTQSLFLFHPFVAAISGVTSTGGTPCSTLGAHQKQGVAPGWVRMERFIESSYIERALLSGST